MSEEENINFKQFKLNVGLNHSPEDNNINIIVIKCFLEVIYIHITFYHDVNV